MQQKALIFGEPENITNPGDDGVTYRFPFSAVDSELVGSPEEARETAHHRLTVKATKSRLDGWKLSPADLERELFEIGRRELLGRAARGDLKPEETVSVNTSTHSATPPFDASRIPDPHGFVLTLEPAPRRIGF